MGFIPWDPLTLERQRARVNRLLDLSHLPGNPESALECPVLNHLQNALAPVSCCTVCRLLHTLITNERDPPVKFFEDYALLCFYTLHAPRCWLSTVIAACDLAEILCRHFPSHVAETPIFIPGGILGIDVQLHFFVHKCFRPLEEQSHGALITSANLSFIKTEFIRGSLSGSISNTICFKTMWSGARALREDKPPKVGGACCTLRGDTQDTPFVAQLIAGGRDRPRDWLQFFWECWQTSELLSHRSPGPGAAPDTSGSGGATHTYAEDSGREPDQCQGPCLLSPSLCLRRKNNTFSVCVLCECLAAHGEAKHALSTLKSKIITAFGNNVNIIDRISVILNSKQNLDYIQSQTLRHTIAQCSPHEIHKHLFCDPLCAVNTRATHPNILFKTPDPGQLHKSKASLATGLHLAGNNILDCDSLNTLIVVFKACQHCRISKTTFNEIIKELDSTLHKHGLPVVQAFQTSQVYV
ncbi:DNA packaging protein UL32 [Common bottlenose dolphin gammaherpesvirus 1 strain Sarasota]|uniref:Packaging protein UL32 n=1 Tax=Common bottlenose dolphin gammaherpesvirus 1 strain Sarasota TaxID=2022783 RepID=A0A1Z1NE95_9GAMA|nr:DNA packaging protein UL32 [Common bottlenose dolphin gammaherpesvirus 1 strain Sarasota]ARW78131.1 DNA packaging protein UL32 [Common bottlenose dolphin gammaherpesvirus 1 strain Sarasota]